MSTQTTELLARGLPEYYPISDASNNYKLLRAPGDQADSLDSEIADAEAALNVTTPNTDLGRFGNLVGITRREDETDGHYRARVLAEFALSTCEGTESDVLDTLATIIGIAPANFELDDRSAPGRASVSLPASALDDQALDQSELREIVERLLAASYALDIIVSGTFTYITPSAYNVNDHDASKAYDGLDSNDEPKDNGGTYAGVIQ